MTRTHGVRRFYRIPEASRVLEISDYRTRQMVLRNELSGWKIGAEWRIDADEVDRLACGAAGNTATPRGTPRPRMTDLDAAE